MEAQDLAPPATVSGQPPSGPQSAVPQRIRLRWGRLWTSLVVVLVGVLTFGFVGGALAAPYVVLAPGNTFETESGVSAKGEKTYETPGTIYFLTVSVRGASQKVSYGGVVWGWLHGDQDVSPRKLILGDQSGAENRRQGLQEMTSAQEVAAKVALDYLGYDVPELGTGTYIVDVLAGTPASKVIKPGDVIIGIDGAPTVTSAVLREQLAGRKPGEKVIVTYERGENREKGEGEVELIADPKDPTHTLLGVVGVLTRDRQFDLPFEVDVETQDVGGPSAGLAMTLGIIDALTPGSLTGGKEVAVTGTIDSEGDVGLVGGVPQKTVAARNAGVALMITPKAEAGEARAKANGKFKVVGADTLEEALAALKSIGGNVDGFGRSGGR